MSLQRSSNGCRDLPLWVFYQVLSCLHIYIAPKKILLIRGFFNFENLSDDRAGKLIRQTGAWFDVTMGVMKFVAQVDVKLAGQIVRVLF